MTRFPAVSKSNKHELVAAALEKAVMDGELKVGEKLPSEQSLAAQFGVSRNIVREALRNLDARGLLEVRNGDGSYIASPKSDQLGDMLTRFIVLGDTSVNDCYEIRFALEVKACELAAARATKDDIEGLEAIIGKMKRNLANREELTKLDFEFHDAIARATKNPLFSSLLQPLKKSLTEIFDFGNSEPAVQEALSGHVRILEALKKGRPSLSGASMTRHLEASESNLIHLARRKDEGLDEGAASPRGA